MDVLCPVCAEPWDLGEFEDVSGMTFTAARRAFAKEGCALFGNKHNEVGPEAAERAAKSRVLFDLLGDDIDGIAAMTEDML